MDQLQLVEHQNDAIRGFNNIINDDTIIIGAETGVYVDAVSEEDRFSNNGVFSITNTTEGIHIDNGLFANSGSIVIDNDSDNGVHLVI
jgi:hypothetical protein